MCNLVNAGIKLKVNDKLNFLTDPKLNVPHSKKSYIIKFYFHLQVTENFIEHNALLRSIEGGVLIGIKCKIKSRAFICSPFDLIERIKIKILCLFHKKMFFYSKKLRNFSFKTLKKCFLLFPVI